MKKTTLIAVGAFAVLLIAVLLTKEDKVNEGVPKLTLPSLSGDITSVETTGAFAAKLSNEGGVWKVNGFVADEGQVKSLTDALKDLRAMDFVTDKPERQAELELDDAKGTKLTVATAGGGGFSVVFGKNGKAGGTYLREAKSNAIFTTVSPVAFMVKKNVSGWRKKAIATAPLAEVAKVTVASGSESFTLVAKDGSWALEPAPSAGFRFDANAATRLVQQLTSLQAQDFTEKLGEPVQTVTLTLKDGKTVGLKLGAKGADGTVPSSVDGDAQVYLLPQWAAGQLMKKQDDLRQLTLMAFEPDKVGRLTLTAAGKTVTVAKQGADWKVLEPKQLPQGFDFDPQTVVGQLQRLKSLQGQKWLGSVSDAQAGFQKPTVSVELALEGGQKQTLKLGGEGEDKLVYAKGSADGAVYALAPFEKSQFEQGLELFKRRPPPDMNQIRGLEQLPPEVRKQLEAQLKQRQN